MDHIFERPLLATEHTDYDTGAEALAFAIAAHCGVALAAVLPITSNPEFEAVAPQLAAKADAEAAARRRALDEHAHAAGLSFDLRVRRGSEQFAEIVAEARDRGSDLIVIRRRGRRGILANLLIGEMVGKVIAHAPCSVLVCARGATMWTRKVLVGIDPQAPDAGLLAQAAGVAAACGLPLHLVCVAGGAALGAAAQHALAAALAQARQRWSDTDGEVRVGRAHEEIVSAAAQCGADLIVIARHRRAPLGRAWIGGTAQKTIGMASCPVLVHTDAGNP
jgi:nucleotide-binding universal stress UspA family protein